MSEYSTWKDRKHIDFHEIMHEAEMYLKDPFFVPQDLREVFDKIYNGGHKSYDRGYSAGYDSGHHDGIAASEYRSGDDD